MPEFLYGLWPAMEVLRSERRHIESVVISDRMEDKGRIGEVLSIARERGILIKRVNRRIMDDLSKGANHQGIVVRVSPYPYVEVDDILAYSEKVDEKPFLLILDLLKDPQNVGALLRVADAVGIHGVIIQDKRGVGITPSVVGSSSGAVEHLRIAQVTNIVTTMKQLKEKNIWFVGLDVGPNVPPLDKTDLDIPIGMVLGSEGDGMRRLVRDTCDLLVTLPMRGKVGSLNVATAGSIALYSAWQARHWQGWAHA